MDRTFWSHWGDGQAEISAYELTYPRYGALRSGVAVAIFVTEPFSYEARVKADRGKHAPGDRLPRDQAQPRPGFSNRHLRL